jgi:hypothetical protein
VKAPSAGRARGLLALIIALAVLLRVALALYLGNVVDAPEQLTDQRSYHALAARLVEGHGFSFAEPWYPFTSANMPTAHWSFLETLLVAAVYAIAGPQPLAARLFHAVLGGILLPWLSFRLARRMFGAEQPDAGGSARTVPLVAALLAAIYPFFLLYAATIMTETFYIAALLWSLERAMALDEALGGSAPVRVRDALALGLALGLAALLRQSILPWMAVLFAWLLARGARQARLVTTIRVLLTALAVMALCILPFTVRNYRVYGEFLLLNSNAGYAMYSAQHPLHGVQFQAFTAAPLPLDEVNVNYNEAQWDRELMRIGVGFVLADPARYVRLSLSRFGDYFEFWPKRDSSALHNLGRVASFGLLLPFMLYGIYLALRSRREPAHFELRSQHVDLALLFMAFYTLLHIATWAMPRYRLPVDAVALPFAALALTDLARRINESRLVMRLWSQ